MTDHLDLEAIKRLFAHRDPHNPYADEIDALISEVERLQADVERKDEALSAIILYDQMPDGESWQIAYATVVEMAEAALSESPTETKGENG